MKSICIKIVIILIILMCIINLIPRVSYALSATEAMQEVKSGIENFPDEYKEKLKKLKELHPNWNFEAYYTGIKWSDFIEAETGTTLHMRSVVPSSKESSWKCSCNNIYSGWACASSAIVAYFANPTNFLTEVNIFEFEELSYNKNVHTLESVQSSVKGTFLDKSVTYYSDEEKKNVTKTYSEIILEAAKKYNISPFHIKSKIIQEVGRNGSDSVSGTCKGYESLYNFFNYGAYDTGNAIVNGLLYAKDKGWNTPYKAMMGGVELLGSSYIEVGQNTSYFFKFDVVGSSILKVGDAKTKINLSSCFRHQYMTNIMDPYGQSFSVYNIYAANGTLDSALNFVIPVYEDMPEYSKKPTILTTKDGELYYANVTEYVNVRDIPSTEAPVVYTVYKDEIVAMVKRNAIKSADGTSWDRVVLGNSEKWNCYIASQYLEPCIQKQEEEPEKQLEKVIIDSEKLEIKTTPITTVTTLIKELKCTDYEIVDSQGKKVEKADEKIATGYKINLLKTDKKTIDKTYTLVKVGDVNGDGKVNSGDYVNIKNHIMETKLLDDISKKGADVSGDAKIMSGDYVLIKKYIMDGNPINI